MTQKEKLYEQVLLAENEYRAIKGKNIVNIEKMQNGGQFSANARRYSVAELKTELKIARMQVEQAKVEKKRDEYWATPEGATHKQELEEKKAMLTDDLGFKRERCAIDAIALLKENLSDRWKVRCDEINHIEIYLTDMVGKQIFGHDFIINHDDEYNINSQSRNYVISSNIGTMGSFDAINDEDRINLYTTYGAILSNKALMTRLLEMMNEWRSIKEKIQTGIREIRKQLENPLAS